MSVLVLKNNVAVASRRKKENESLTNCIWAWIAREGPLSWETQRLTTFRLKFYTQTIKRELILEEGFDKWKVFVNYAPLIVERSHRRQQPHSPINQENPKLNEVKIIMPSPRGDSVASNLTNWYIYKQIHKVVTKRGPLRNEREN